MCRHMRGHVEHFGTFVGVLAEGRDRVDRFAPGSGPGSKVRIDQRTREAVDPRRHRRVGGEQHAWFDRLPQPRSAWWRRPGAPCLIEQRQGEKAGMALVRVVDARVPADRPNGTRTADPEHEFLLEPVQLVAAIEPIGDLPIGLGVDREIGVEQQQRDPADVEPPHLGVDVAIGDRDLDDDAGVDATEIGGVVGFDPLGLLSTVEHLAKEAMPVEQADTGQRGTDVAGRLEMVAGQDAETTRVLRHELADPELGREVDDVGVADRPSRACDRDPPADWRHRPRSRRDRAVTSSWSSLRARDSLYRVPVGGGRRQGREQVGRAVVPGPEMVRGEGIQGRSQRGAVHVWYSKVVDIELSNLSAVAPGCAHTGEAGVRLDRLRSMIAVLGALAGCPGRDPARVVAGAPSAASCSGAELARSHPGSVGCRSDGLFGLESERCRQC